MMVRATRLLHFLGHLLTPLFLVLLTVLSLTPATGSVSLFPWLPYSDKISHLLGYAALGCSMLWSVAVADGQAGVCRQCARNRWRMAGSWGLTVLVGSVVEWVQPLFGRSAEWLDLLADALGASAGILFGIICIELAVRRDGRRS